MSRISASHRSACRLAALSSFDCAAGDSVVPPAFVGAGHDASCIVVSESTRWSLRKRWLGQFETTFLCRRYTAHHRSEAIRTERDARLVVVRRFARSVGKPELRDVQTDQFSKTRRYFGIAVRVAAAKLLNVETCYVVARAQPARSCSHVVISSTRSRSLGMPGASMRPDGASLRAGPVLRRRRSKALRAAFPLRSRAVAAR